MNVTQRILQHLADLNEDTRKASIAKALGTSENYVAKSLADLARGNYIRQIKGWYRITARGRNAIQRDPDLVDFFVNRGGENKITIQLPMKYISQDKMCRKFIEQSEELKVKLGPVTNELMPAVLAWLICNGVKLPTFTGEYLEDERDNQYHDVYQEFFINIYKIANGLDKD